MQSSGALGNDDPTIRIIAGVGQRRKGEGMEQRELINIDGLVIDALTGEIVEHPPGFVLDSPEKLDWYVGKVRQLRALADAESELSQRVAKRAYALLKAHESFQAAFAADAERVALPLIPKGRKSVMLEHGEVGFRKGLAGIDINDEEEAVEACKTLCPDAIKWEGTIRKSVIAERFSAVPNLPPGISRHEATEKFWVK